ncbi:ATPase components of ABC transporter [Enhygromyxa salina]|uniref:ATPase components of ABC transporter n=1 Tax=Enhygromyxa salina TaxID=215803 RepID=A0A0C1ZML1_9BACT|nr:ATP-binding cassette domain-containing protein [Enhygromyxa salina]KIG12263.1 ATPase components of ABC transporter [Enhygromyxa salina]
MSLVVFEKVSLGFGQKTIVNELDLRIGDGERIGLIGSNGSGKSTLLKLLSGDMKPDSGRITSARGLEIGWLPQDIAVEGGRSLIEFVLASVPGRELLGARIEQTEAELAAVQAEVESDARPIDDEELMELATRLAELHERATHFEMHYSEHEALKILSGLGFAPSDHQRDLGELSGGWKMRAVLGSLLFQRPDLMLLDEPTNHLDMPSVAWFGDFLQKYRRSFLLICHDREFLDEQIDRVVTFEPEGVRQYRGNYQAYQRQREEEEIILENKARNLGREREKAEQFIDRFRAQANKAKAVQSRVKALAKLDDVVLFEKRRVMRFTFPPCDRAGHEVVKIRGLKKAYSTPERGDHVVFPGLDLSVSRGDKIGIIGINGAGKTTLLRMIAGEISHDAGELEIGHKVTPGYYAQHHAESLHRELTVFEEVAQQDPHAGQTRVRSILGAFLYSGDDVDKKIAVLSGGERARVALAKLLIKPGNLLLMDEPTNHLDLESSESLAESLSTYDGTVLFVSHNRSFVRKLATKIWNVHDGTVEIYPGTLDEYLASARERGEALEAVADGKAGPTKQPQSADASSKQAVSKVETKGAPAAGSDDAGGGAKRDRAAERERKRKEAEERAQRNKRLKPLQRQVTELEARINELEQAQKQRSVELADPAVYEDAERRGVLLDEYQAAAAKLEELSGRWELASMELEEQLEQLEA